MKQIAIFTDSWYPLVNGVVTTLQHIADELREQGYDVLVFHPGLCSKTFKCPSYPEIMLAWRPHVHIKQFFKDYQPQAVHIATEGPVGYAARKWCIDNGKPFTTSYHTKFPEYVRARYPIPLSFTYRYLRIFHSEATATLVTTDSIKKELEERKFKNLITWGRGVDTKKFAFKPGEDNHSLIYVGRVSIEKNIEEFLKLGINGYKKVVVGDGPDLPELKKKYPHVDFQGYKKGDDLVKAYQDASIFVFPSKTDTFGLVMLEANACGLPVAAYPVPGPIDVVQNGVNGYLNDDLGSAVLQAINRVKPESCRAFAEKHSWNSCAKIFLDTLTFF